MKPHNGPCLVTTVDLRERQRQAHARGQRLYHRARRRAQPLPPVSLVSQADPAPNQLLRSSEHGAQRETHRAIGPCLPTQGMVIRAFTSTSWGAILRRASVHGSAMPSIQCTPPSLSPKAMISCRVEAPVGQGATARALRLTWNDAVVAPACSSAVMAGRFFLL